MAHHSPPAKGVLIGVVLGMLLWIALAIVVFATLV